MVNILFYIYIYMHLVGVIELLEKNGLLCLVPFCLVLPVGEFVCLTHSLP